MNRLITLISNNNNNNKQIGSVTAKQITVIFIFTYRLSHILIVPLKTVIGTDCIYQYNISFKKMFFSNNMCPKAHTLFVLIVKFYVQNYTFRSFYTENS